MKRAGVNLLSRLRETSTSNTENMKTETIETTEYAGIDYAAGQPVNRNMETGLRYGVIHSNQISPEAFDDIATHGTDVDFENYRQTIKDAIKRNLESALDDYLTKRELELTIESAQETAMENCGDNYDNQDCTRYEYDAYGYSIQTASDGDMFVKNSPFFTYAQFCSPCAPGACYLASPLSSPVEANKCYCLGKDWFDEFNPCPYPVYSVETGNLV